MRIDTQSKKKKHLLKERLPLGAVLVDAHRRRVVDLIWALHLDDRRVERPLLAAGA
jgi:hypothetical protein